MNTTKQSRPSRLLTAPNLMDVSSKFNSPETDLKVIVPLVSREENPQPLSSVVTSASALTKIALLASSNKLDPLLRSELPRPKMAVPRDSVTLNSRRSMTQRKLLIVLTEKTLMDVTSDSTYQPTEAAVVEEEEVIVADAVAVSEVVVEAVASVAAVVEATDSEAAATGSVTEEAVAASEEAAMATEETDHLTAVTVTEEEEAAHTEVIANAALEVIAAVTDVAEAVVVAATPIVVEEAIEEVVEEVSNGIE